MVEIFKIPNFEKLKIQNNENFRNSKLWKIKKFKILKKISKI